LILGGIQEANEVGTKPLNKWINDNLGAVIEKYFQQSWSMRMLVLIGGPFVLRSISLEMNKSIVQIRSLLIWGKVA
jgi:hypothetical protein